MQETNITNIVNQLYFKKMKNITENIIIIIITNTLLHNDIYYKCCR